MPAMHLDDQQIARVTAYLESLALKTAPRTAPGNCTRETTDMATFAPPPGTPPALHEEEQPLGRRRILVEYLHGWVVTTDHKRLGILYILSGLVFLLIGGLEATVIRLQLAWPGQHVVSAETFNRLFTMHGTTMVFFVGMPMLLGFGNYLIPLMLGARDMAFPRLNAFSFWISLFGGLLLYYSVVGGDGLYGAGTAPDVGWFAYAPLTSKVFSPGHSAGLLDAGRAPQRHRFRGHRAEHRNHDAVPAMPRHEADEHAAAGVAVPCDRLPDPGGSQSVDRSADHAVPRPLSWGTLLRYAGGRLCRAVDALLLDLRASRGVHPGAACVCLRERDHSGVLAQGHLRISRHGHCNGGHRLHQPERVGAPHVYGRPGAGAERLLHARDHDHCGAYRHQDLQLAGDRCGEAASASRHRCCSRQLFCSIFLWRA